MTKTPIPCTQTNEPAQASSLPSLAVTGASGNVGGVVARLLSERGLPLRLLANTPSHAPKLPGAHALPHGGAHQGVGYDVHVLAR